MEGELAGWSPESEPWSEEAPYGRLGLWYWPGTDGPGGVRRLWRFMDVAGASRLGLPGNLGLDDPGRGQDGRLDAVLEAVAGAGVRYEREPPFGWLDHGQHLRDPVMIERGGGATCLDMALLVAAALRNANLRSWIVLGRPQAPRAPGHAWLMVDVAQDLNEPNLPMAGAGLSIDDYERAVLEGGWRPVEGFESLLGRAETGRMDLRLVDVARLTVGYPGGAAEGAEVGRGGWTDFLEPYPMTWVCDTGWWSDQLVHTRPTGDLRQVIEPVWPTTRLDPTTGDLSLADLARTDNRVLEFVGSDAYDRAVREVDTFLADLADLGDRVEGLEQVQVLVLTGQGGAGKTRLAKELVDRLDGPGFGSSGTRGQLPQVVERADLRAVAAEPGGVALLIDYADAVPTVQVGVRAVPLVTELRHWLSLRPAGWGPVVVVATGREPGSWSEDLERFPRSRSIPVTPYTWGEGPRAALFDRAAAYFSTLTGQAPVRVPGGDVRPWSALETIFLVGLAAFADGTTLPKGGVAAVDAVDELYRRVLVHERRKWAAWWEASLNRSPGSSEIEDLAVVLAAVSLTHPTGRELAPVLEREGYAAGCTEVAHRVGFGAFRSATDPEGFRRRLPGIQPDPLADYLVRDVLRTDDVWPLVTALVGGRWRDLLEVLQRAYLHIEAPGWLVGALAAVVTESEALVEDVLALAEASPGPARAVLAAVADTDLGEQRVAELLEDRAGPAVATARAVLARRRVARHRADGLPMSDLAMALNSLGVRLSELGRRGEALAPTEEAVAIYRGLAAEQPAFLPALASALNNLGIFLSELGRWGEALAPTEEAVAIYRGLAAEQSAFLPDLAMALNNLGVRLSELGRRGEALAPTEEAVAIRRGLAAEQSAFLPALASALNNLGIRLSELGRRGEALAPTEEAVAIRRGLAAEQSAFLPDLAMALNSLGVRLSELGRRGEALAPTEEAVAIYRGLAAEQSAFLPALASALNNLGIRLSELGRRGEALAPTEEAVAIRRGLAAEQSAFLPDLAMALNNLGIRLSELGRRGEALAPTEEAVAIYRGLAAEQSAFLPDLAMALNNLGIFLSELGRRGEALAPTEEAVAIYRGLAAEQSAFLPDLAMALNSLGVRLSELGRRGEALAPTEEAVAIYRGLAAEQPAFLPALASALNNLGIRLSELGRRGEALAPTEEAVAIRRGLAAEQSAFLPDLAMALNNLGVRLSELGRRGEALAPTEEAVAIRRGLAAEQSAFLPALASALNNLGIRLSELGRRGEALAPTEEAVAIRRGLAAEQSAFLPALASALNNLGIRLSELGRRGEALAPTEEAVAIRRGLAAEQPAFLPALASALNNLGIRLSELGRRGEALAPTEEAVAIYRGLAAEQSAFLPDLAMALNNLGIFLSELGRRGEALAPTEEAVAIYRGLAAEQSAFLPALASALNNLGIFLSELGRRGEALAPTEEAVAIRRGLAAEQSAFLPDLASALNNLEQRLIEVGRSADDCASARHGAYAGLSSAASCYLRASRLRRMAEVSAVDVALSMQELQVIAAASAAEARDLDLLGRARRIAHEVVTGYDDLRRTSDIAVRWDPDLPTPLDVTVAWVNVVGTPDELRHLEPLLAGCTASDIRRTVDHLRFLHPEKPGPVHADRRLDEIDNEGTEAVIGAMRERQQLLTWVAEVRQALDEGNPGPLRQLLEADRRLGLVDEELRLALGEHDSRLAALFRSHRRGDLAVVVGVLPGEGYDRGRLPRTAILRSLGRGGVEQALDMATLAPGALTASEHHALRLAVASADGRLPDQQLDGVGVEVAPVGGGFLDAMGDAVHHRTGLGALLGRLRAAG